MVLALRTLVDERGAKCRNALSEMQMGSGYEWFTDTMLSRQVHQSSQFT